MKREERIEVDKVWGEEIWLVNTAEYCSKLLVLHKDAESSYHSHSIKKETFFCLEGRARLIVEGKEYLLSPVTLPKTIDPGERHKFIGVSDSVILEVSTHHDETDVKRFSESKPGRLKC